MMITVEYTTVNYDSYKFKLVAKPITLIYDVAEFVIDPAYADKDHDRISRWANVTVTLDTDAVLYLTKEMSLPFAPRRGEAKFHGDLAKTLLSNVMLHYCG